MAARRAVGLAAEVAIGAVFVTCQAGSRARCQRGKRHVKMAIVATTMAAGVTIGLAKGGLTIWKSYRSMANGTTIDWQEMVSLDRHVSCYRQVAWWVDVSGSGHGGIVGLGDSGRIGGASRGCNGLGGSACQQQKSRWSLS